MGLRIHCHPSLGQHKSCLYLNLILTPQISAATTLSKEASPTARETLPEASTGYNTEINKPWEAQAPWTEGTSASWLLHLGIREHREWGGVGWGGG